MRVNALYFQEQNEERRANMIGERRQIIADRYMRSTENDFSDCYCILNTIQGG